MWYAVCGGHGGLNLLDLPDDRLRSSRQRVSSDSAEPATVVENPDDIADLLNWMIGRLPVLVDEVMEVVADRVPMYGADRVTPDDWREAIRDSVSDALNAIANPTAPPVLSSARATGRRRAQQGIPLPEVLRAYQLVVSATWEALDRHTTSRRKPGDADALLAIYRRIWGIVDEFGVALSQGYQEASTEIVVSSERRRSAVVEALLAGHPVPGDLLAEAQAVLGLPPDGSFVVIVAETRGVAEESLPGIERHLGDRGIVSIWRLTPALQVGLVSLHADQRDVALDLLGQTASARAGVSPEYQSLAETPRALDLARSALGMMRPGQVGVRVFGSNMLEALMARNPRDGERLAQHVLGRVLAMPTNDRKVLLDTLSAYFEHHGSARAAAKVLHCHPNTVRYRLRRLHELTGRSLSDPQEIAELAAATYALQLRPDPVSEETGG